jgi:hypothetical protein
MPEAEARTSIADSDLVAEREFEMVDPTGNAGTLHVRVARPVVHEADGSWSCALHLPEVEDTVHDYWGEDSMQALVHAMYIIPVLLTQLRRDGFQLTFFGHEELLLAEFELPGASLG